MRWIRGILAAGLVAGVCLLPSGCIFGDRFPPRDLVAGLSRAPDGTLLAVVAVCAGFVDQAVLSDVTDPNNATATDTWRSSGHMTGVVVWPLSGDGSWKSAVPFPGLRPGRRYWFSSQGDTGDPDTTHVSMGVDVTAQDLARLSPGQVRFEVTDTTNHPRTTTMTGFRALACPVSPH